MIASKALFVSAIFVLLLQVQGQRWVSKCSERPVIKNFDISRVSFHRDGKSRKLINNVSVRRQMVRHLSLRRRFLVWLSMRQCKLQT